MGTYLGVERRVLARSSPNVGRMLVEHRYGVTSSVFCVCLFRRDFSTIGRLRHIESARFSSGGAESGVFYHT